MPRTRLHKLGDNKSPKPTNESNNQTEDKVMTNNETISNGNSQLTTTANLNKLASALGEQYQPEVSTVEDLLFGDKPANETLSNLAKLLGASEQNLASLLISDSLEGKGEISKLLRLISDEIKDKELQAKQLQLELEKQHLLQQVKELDNQLNCLAAGTII